MGRDEDGVSDAIGSILLVGITIAMMAGFSVLVLSVDGPTNKVHADLNAALEAGNNGWGTGDEVIKLIHLGGEPVNRNGMEIHVIINGTPTVFADPTGGFADGKLTIGESWSEVLLIPKEAIVDVLAISRGDNQLVASSTLVAKGGLIGGVSATVTYVSTHVDVVGTTTDFAASQSGDDGGAEARLTEDTVPGGVQNTRFSGSAIFNSLGATNPANVLTDDGARSRFLDTGHTVEVNGFDMPAAAASINSVTIGFQGQRSGGGSAATMQISYTTTGLPGSSTTFVVDASNDQDYTLDVSGDRLWTVALVEAMVVKVERISPDATFRDVDVDHMFVVVNYAEAPSTDLNVEYRFNNVPSGTEHELQVRYRVETETFSIQVFDGAVWTTRGTLTSTSPTVFTYAMTAPEYNAGDPKIRFRENDTGATTGQIHIDFARIRST